MIETPETDAFDSKWDSYSHPFEAIDLARKLERERDEAMEKLADALQEVDLRTLDFARMKQERDIAEDERVEMAQQLESEKDCHDRCQNKRDEAQEELEEYRSIAENIGAVKAVSEKEKAIFKWDETLEKLAPLRQSLCDSQDEVLRLTFENRELNQGIDEALILGNKLADECERILGLGLHQNTIERFKAALEAWKDYNNE